jgi:hypothetical protein
MRFASIAVCCLCLAAAIAADADPLARWVGGSGTGSGATLGTGQNIAGGTVISTGSSRGEMALVGAPGSRLIIGPESTLVLIETTRGGGPTLEVMLTRGVLEMDLPDRGRFTEAHVLGAVCDVRVTGTIFVVERTRADADYVALIKGRVQVGVRPELAAILANGKTLIDLIDRQGLTADRNAGLGQAETLQSRPTIAATSATSGTSTRDQGQRADPSGASWSTTTTAPVVTETPPAATVTPDDTAGLAATVTTDMASGVVSGITQEIVQEATQATLDGLGAIPPPPAPPTGP